jgi:hypothetical protein
MFAKIGLRHRSCHVEQYNGLQRGHRANTGRREITGFGEPYETQGRLRPIPLRLVKSEARAEIA